MSIDADSDDGVLAIDDLRGDDELSESEKRHAGYADYERIATSLAKSINDAVEAYALLESRHVEHAKVKPGVAAEVRSLMLGTALKLEPKLASDSDVVNEYETILKRWFGEGYNGDGGGDGGGAIFDGTDEDDGPAGYVGKLDQVNLQQRCPLWLRQFALDMQTAGWKLGYLRAGRQESVGETDQTEEMLS